MIAVLFAVLSLADAQSLALERAPGIVEARARVTEAEALVRVSRGAGALHGILNYNQSPQAGAADNSVLQRLTTLGAQVSLSDLAGRDPAIAQAEASLRSAQSSEIDAERAERIKVIGLYVDAQRTHEVRLLQETIAEAALADAHAAALRFLNGDASRLDEERASIAHLQAEADVMGAQADERNALAALAMEVGRTSASLELPELANAEIPAGLPAKDRAVDLALARRPEIAMARADVDAQASAVRVARSATLPAVTAQIGYTQGTDTQIDVHGPSANLTIDFPVSAAPSAQVAAQNARVDQARARLAAAEQAIALEVGAAREALTTDNMVALVARGARLTAQQELKAAQLGYREGATSSLELIDARRTFAQVAIAELTAQAAFDEALDAWPLTLGETP